MATGDISNFQNQIKSASANAGQRQQRRLTRLSPRDIGKQARGKRRWVASLKWLLPLLSLAIVALAAIWPLLQLLPQSLLQLELKEFISSGIGEMKLEKARLMTSDGDGKLYNMTADEIKQDAQRAELVSLKAPKADMLMTNNQWMFISAADGEFNSQSQELLLRGEVNLFEDQGYEILTDNLWINFENDQIISKSGVSGQGPSGQFAAEGIRIEQRGAVIRLLGESKMRFYD